MNRASDYWFIHEKKTGRSILKLRSVFYREFVMKMYIYS